MRGTTVNRGVWTEGLLLVAISLASLAESIRLVLSRGSQMFVDWLGPGYYLLVISIGMLATGIAHIYHHRKDKPVEKEETSKEMRVRLISSFVACVIYLILINVLGYLSATFVFFILMFRIVGIRSWTYNIVLSAAVSAAYYVMFVKCCDMVFPRGILL
jgi:uncharacterized membrane protein YidH (DUF202 family)